MRRLLFATSTLVFASAAAVFPASAQSAGGNPKSGTASNIDQSDTRSAIAPALPTPGATGTAEDYLRRAQQALRAGRTGEAQEALERAETRLLDRSTTPDSAGQADTSPRVDAVRQALTALGHKNRAGAMSAIQTAMTAADANATSASGGMVAMPGTGGAAPVEPMGTMPAPAGSQAGSVPHSANGVAVNPMGGTNQPDAGNQGSAATTPGSP